MPRNVLKTAEEIVAWLGRRRAEKQIEREVKMRQGKASIRRHILNQQKLGQRLWELGKRALSLGDEAQFRRVGALYVQTQEDVARWERYLLTFETLEARREQAQAARDFVEALQALNESLIGVGSPEETARLQRDLAQALTRAETLEDRMALMLELTDEALFAGEPVSEADLAHVQEMMATEVAAEESDLFDTRIEEGLRRIRQEMQQGR